MRKRVRLLTNEQIKRAEENGVSYATLYKRVTQSNWGIEKAINTPTKALFGNTRSKFTDEELRIAASNGVCHAVLCGRVNKWGWGIEEAITTPPGGKRNKKREPTIKRPEWFTKEKYLELKKQGLSDQYIYTYQLEVSNGTFNRFKKELGLIGVNLYKTSENYIESI
jgi:hypothetical protein